MGLGAEQQAAEQGSAGEQRHAGNAAGFAFDNGAADGPRLSPSCTVICVWKERRSKEGEEIPLEVVGSGELTSWLIIMVTTPLEFTRAVMLSVTPVLWLLTVLPEKTLLATRLNASHHSLRGQHRHVRSDVHGGRDAVRGDDAGHAEMDFTWPVVWLASESTPRHLAGTAHQGA